jgi:hypothetical protein
VANPTGKREDEEQGNQAEDTVDVEFEPDQELEHAIVGEDSGSSEGRKGDTGKRKGGRGEK